MPTDKVAGGVYGGKMIEVIDIDGSSPDISILIKVSIPIDEYTKQIRVIKISKWDLQKLLNYAKDWSE